MAAAEIATTPAADAGQIDDTPPPGAELVSGEMLDQLLNRFDIGPELESPQPPSTAQPTAPAAEPPPATPPVAEAAPDAPAQTPEPAPVTPALDEAELQRRLDARAEEVRAEFSNTVAERDNLRQQNEALQQRLRAFTTPPPLPKTIDPLLLEDDDTELARHEREAEQTLRWCDEHEDTGYTPTREGEQPWTPQQVRALRRNIEKRLSSVLPKARELAGARAQQRELARKQFPELFDGKSDAYAVRQAFLRRAPWIYSEFPQFDFFIASAIAGEKLAASLKKPAGQSAPASAPPVSPQPKAPPAPVIPTPSGAAAPPAAAAATQPRRKGVDVEEFVKRGGNRQALVDVLRAGGF